MRWPVTADTTLSIRDAIARIDRSNAGGIVVVDEEHRLVGSATNGRLRGKLLEGETPDTPIVDVLDDDRIVVDPGDEGGDGDPGQTIDRSTAGIEGDRATFDPAAIDDSGGIDGPSPTVTGCDEREIGSEPESVDTVLVVGGAGYLGSVLCRQLLERGFAVRVLDPLLYGDGGIAALTDDDRFTLLRGDARSVSAVLEAIDGVDAVVHLGGIVGDPASELEPTKTLAYNLHSTRLLASICKYHGINRFVFASTCSVYGRADDESGRLSETAARNPVSLYARLKIQSERVLRDLADERFSPTILRMATIYGCSPRMRFDLVGNVLPAKAHADGVIPVFGGDQYRPNVHVADAARAYVDCLTAPLEDVADAVFNVGSNRQNYRIDELATIVADCFPDASIEYHEDRTDERSYRVEFEKIRTELGYEPERTVRGHCLELKRALEAGVYDDHTATRYDNYETLERAPSFEETDAVLEPVEPPAFDRSREKVPSGEA